jgi:hypothetical protein
MKYAVGMLVVLVFAAASLSAQIGKIPEGFTPIFDGKDLKGWHLSRTNHHGSTGNVYVEDGVMVLKQKPYGQGGIILTNRKYRDFELYLETKLGWGCNGGIFLRSTESGSAYQIELDQGGGTANLIGEMLRVAKGARATDIEKVWKYDDWNSFRIRMTGEAPHIILWVNEVQMWDVTADRNDLTADATDGMIALQLHWSSLYAPNLGSQLPNSWRPGGAHRFRNIAIKEIK